MKELISTIVEVILIPAIPIVAAHLVKLFKAKASEAATNCDNTILSALLYEATEAVSTAVTYTAQTYVDSLKVQGKFDAEAQKTALDTALDKAKLLLTQEAQELLAQLYGDVDEWLTVKIEQAVKEQKIVG